MKIILPIELEECIIFDEKGEKIKGIKSIQSFKNGFIVLTENGVYTNVKSLLKKVSLTNSLIGK